MIFFGKRSDYMKFDDVISILCVERSKHWQACVSSIGARNAIDEAIKSVKLHHIKNNPKKFMVRKTVLNDEAQYLLKCEEDKKAKEAEE